MERTLTAFSAIILLIGCCTGCGRNVNTSKIKIPDIAFLYYKSSEAGLTGKFCDKNGNCYSVLTDEVNYLKPDELMEKFSEGSLEKDIKLLKTFDKDELENMYSAHVSGRCIFKCFSFSVEFHAAAAVLFQCLRRA